MTDQTPLDEALERLRAADPSASEHLESISRMELDAARQRVRALSERPQRSTGTAVSPRSPLALRVAAVSAVVAIAAVAALSGTGTPNGVNGPTFATAAVRVAKANSRLLVTEPGWSVIRADEFTPDSGEIEFSDGTHTAQITWYPGRYYDEYRRDRAADPGPDVPITVLGLQGIMIRYEGSTDFATMLPVQGSTFVEIRGDLGSEEAYRSMLASVEHTDVETWLSAMPASVVQPTDRSTVVDSMLEGVPVPPGLDLTELRGEDAVLDRYQLGAAVTGAVACEWLDRWAAADKAGDASAKAESVEAMATSRSWPILREMASEGDWSPVVWQYARQIEHGKLDRGIAMTSTEGGKTYEYGPGYAVGLGCDSQFKRLAGE